MAPSHGLKCARASKQHFRRYERTIESSSLIISTRNICFTCQPAGCQCQYTTSNGIHGNGLSILHSDLEGPFDVLILSKGSFCHGIHFRVLLPKVPWEFGGRLPFYSARSIDRQSRSPFPVRSSVRPLLPRSARSTPSGSRHSLRAFCPFRRRSVRPHAPTLSLAVASRSRFVRQPPLHCRLLRYLSHWVWNGPLARRPPARSPHECDAATCGLGGQLHTTRRTDLLPFPRLPRRRIFECMAFALLLCEAPQLALSQYANGAALLSLGWIIYTKTSLTTQHEPREWNAVRQSAASKEEIAVFAEGI